MYVAVSSEPIDLSQSLTVAGGPGSVLVSCYYSRCCRCCCKLTWTFRVVVARAPGPVSVSCCCRWTWTFYAVLLLQAEQHSLKVFLSLNILLLLNDLGPFQCDAVAEYVAVAGGPGPVPVLVDVGCGGGSRPDHLAWHTQ